MGEDATPRSRVSRGLIGPLERREERPLGFIWLIVAEQVRQASGWPAWDVYLLFDPLPEQERWWPRPGAVDRIVEARGVSDPAAGIERLRSLVMNPCR